MCICWHFFNQYTYFCVSYIIVISDRIGHTLFKIYFYDIKMDICDFGVYDQFCYTGKTCKADKRQCLSTYYQGMP